MRQKRWMLWIGLSISMAAATGCSGGTAESVAPSRDGALAVGFRRLEAPGRLAVKSWYPAERSIGSPSHDAVEGAAIAYSVTLKNGTWLPEDTDAVVHGHAIENALIELAGPERPLIVFSHGYALNPEWYSGLLEHFASRGFIVLAPEHDEHDWLDAADASFDRPRDVERTLALAEALTAEGGAWAGRIDLDSIAVVGHSFGGYAALASAGARFDLAALQARCAALASDDPKTFLCAPFIGREADMAARAGLAAVPEGLWPTTLGNPRVRAIVSMAGDAYLMNESGLANVTVPMMALGGTADFGTPWEWGAKLSYDHVSSLTKSLVAFEGADHMIAANACDVMPFTAALPSMLRDFVCLDAAPWERARAQSWIQHFTTAFLLDVLTGDPAARDALRADGALPAGLSYVRTQSRP